MGMVSSEMVRSADSITVTIWKWIRTAGRVVQVLPSGTLGDRKVSGRPGALVSDSGGE